MYCIKCGAYIAANSNFCTKCGANVLDNMISVFSNGFIVKTEPHLNNYYEERDKINNSRYIISDGIQYDLENESSIFQILIPNNFVPLNQNIMGVTGYLDYVLRMKASNLRESGKKHLSIALLKKANRIMEKSPICWAKKDYMKLVYWMYEDGRFNEADEEEARINSFFSSELIYGQSIHVDLYNAAQLGTDIVEADYFEGCCSECAKYRGRWFSISGTDKRFPKMPYNYNCNCSGLTFSPVILGISEPSYCPKSRNIIEYSNRPFIDDRSNREKAMHQQDLDEIVYENIKIRDKKEYYKLKYFMPDIMPKSFNAYRRIKKENSKAFQNISEKARDLGINILLTDEEKKIIKRYLARSNKSGRK